MKNHVNIQSIQFSYDITINILLLTSCMHTPEASKKERRCEAKKERQLLVYASGLMKGAGRWGGDQLINQILLRTRVRRIDRHCGLNAQVEIYPRKNVVLVGCKSAEPNQEERWSR